MAIDQKREPSEGTHFLQGKLEQARDKLSEVRDVVTEQSGEAVVTAEKYVGGHPWKSLVLAGSIGIVVGMLIARR